MCPGPGCKATLDYDSINQFANKNDFIRYVTHGIYSEKDMMSCYARKYMKQTLTFDGAQIANVEQAKSSQMEVAISVVMCSK